MLQTVQKKQQQQQFTYGQTVQKKKKTIYIWTDSAKKPQTITYGQTVQKKQQQTIYIWTDSAKKKTALEHYSAPDSAKKNKKKTTIYIWTVHIYRLYRRQCAKYTYIYSVHIVYYKDTLNYQRHIIHPLHIIHTLYTLDTSMHHRIKLEHNPQSMQSVLLVFSSLSSSFAKHMYTDTLTHQGCLSSRFRHK